jgi:acetyl-CoA synthetase
VASTTSGPVDYASAASAFRLEDVERLFQGSFANGMNVCSECCDRHPAEAVALEWEGVDGSRATLTFGDLRKQSARVANLLTSRGIKPGDVVAAMLPRTPELVATILGVWRAGAVYQPLFTAFGPKAVEQRLRTSGAKLVVTDGANRAKFDEVPAAPPVAVVKRKADEAIRAGDLDLKAELLRQDTAFEPVIRRGGDLFMMMSTSGTTGSPKGVPVPLSALSSILVYMRDCIELRSEDRFWNLADPGWAYGLYYAVIGPLLMGHATTLYEGPFTVESTYRIIDTHRITNLAGAPTAFRLMIAAGPEAAARVKGRLRAINSAGEPLNPEIFRWCAEHLSAPIHDHYGQTENGIMVANHHRLRHYVKPGSAGFPVPGFRIVVLDEAGNELAPNVPGVLAVDMARSPLMWFTGYWQQETPAIGGGYYRTGDTVELEPDGRISFIGRSDDVITSSGYRIGPFDVESALIEHPAVVESAVIGKPDAERTEIVKAFVVLKPGVQASNALAEELSQFVKQRLSAHAYPREVEFAAQLPKTPSGKLQRFILRNNEIAKAKGQAAI